ncbi:MAG TPA: serine hydrolase domain-containing protein [Acetobacteraceae bacterium]|jgi:CubicO group peptidase (beta-lactamase class C family)|nr:serine hydrolase domain-containing protein [Acetobacteraceae bacterium]
MDWHRATEVASAIAARWTTEGGPGGAILLFDADDIRAEACGGLASLELRAPFTADTTIRYASISKHFLGALVLRLCDAGLLSLDDALGAHLPDLSPALAAVPLGRALDMTSGLPDVMETQWLLGVPWTAGIDRHALLRFVCRLDALNYQPGREISYTNTGYRLIEAALALKSHPVNEALHQHLFAPLALLIHLAEDETEPVAGLATGYWRDAAGWRRGRYGLNFSASGGLAGTARDLVTWLQALLGNRAPADGLLARLGARRHLTDGRPTGYGLGLARMLLAGEIAIGHGGSLPGYKNEFVLLPEHRVGVVVLSNREDTGAADIALDVLAALTGATRPPPAADLLPNGLFITDAGPYWIEHDAGKLTFLGAMADLFVDDAGWAANSSAHYPIRLRAEAGAIEGEIGQVAHRFHPLAPDATLNAAWQGTWHCAAHDARFTIARDGEAWRMISGTGPLHASRKLLPLDANRALTSRTDGPWRQRACLSLQPDGRLLAVTHRSRMLRFVRETY